MKIPPVSANDWGDLFWFMANQVKHDRAIIVLDEISWMGSKDPDFLGKLKNAWDLYLKDNPELILILCDSVSTWIDKNIVSSAGYVGRISFERNLRELPLDKCEKFWKNKINLISNYEKLKMLAVTGGVPLYLEHINPNLSSEENIKNMCFTEGAILYKEFDKIFSDLFSRRNNPYKKIVSTLISGSAKQTEITERLGKSKTGDLSGYLDDLVESGFLARDFI